MLRLVAFLCFYILVSISFAQIPKEGLQLWLKADAGLQLENNAVLKWNDQSGNGNDAFTSTSRKPVVSFDESRKIKGVRFNGWDNGMMTKPFQSFPDKRGTIIVVARVNGASFTSGIGAGSLASTYHGDGNTWQIAANADKYSFFDGIGRQGYFNPESFSPGWRIVTLTRPADTLIRFFFNGEHPINHPIIDSQPSVNSFKIGYNALKVHPEDSVTEVLNGDIAEIILYDRALSETELADVHHVLLAKYHFPEPPKPFYKTAWFILLIVLLLISSTVAGVKWRGQRKLKKQLQELLIQKQIDQERHRISREMHDDIGAGLTQIILMSDAAKRNISAVREIEQISLTSRKLVSNMSEIIWSLNPENKTLDQLMYYLREQLHNLLEYSGFAYHIILPENGHQVHLHNDAMRTILLVIKEIVNNSIKHSQGSTINVAISLKDSILSVKITDDGRGFNMDTVSSGNGLKNIRYRIDRLGGKAELHSEKGKGFQFTWSLELSGVSTT